jgi:hypothetical protein
MKTDERNMDCFLEVSNSGKFMFFAAQGCKRQLWFWFAKSWYI